MAIIFTEDLTRNQGKLANADIIQGSWRTVGSKSDLNALTGSVSDRQTIEDGQLFWAKDEDKFYRYKVVQVGFSQTLSFEEFSFGGGGSVPDGTISGSQQVTDLGFNSTADTGSFLTSADTGSFVLISSTSSMSVATASYIDPTFISASAAESGFGAGGGESTDISALNTFTGSIQTEVDNLTNDTSSYLTSVPSGTVSGSGQITSVINDTYISASAAASGFGSGGGSVGTLQQVTDQGNTTNVSMSIMGLEIFSNNGGENLFLGSEVAGNVSSKGDRNTVIGMSASYGNNPFGSWLKQDNTIIGANAMSNVWRSSRTTVLGASAFYGFRSGSDNTIIGKSAATFIVTGSRNVAIGVDSGFDGPEGQSGTTNNSIWIGYRAVNYGDNTVTIGNDEITDNYFTGNLTGSIQDVYIEEWGSISASLASLNGGGESTDISALNTFTASIETEVDSLTSATSSYLTSVPSGTVSGSQQITDLGFIDSVPSGTVSGSTQITSVIDDTYISASAAAGGFGSGGSAQSLQDMLDASANQELTLSGSLNLNQPTDADLNYNEVRAGSISALNGGGFWGEISDINANRTALNIGISADDDNFVQTKLYSGEGYNSVDPRSIYTRLYPHDYVLASSQSKYVEATAKGLTGADSFREYFQVDINTSQAKYLSPLTASNGFVADEIKISSIDSATTNPDKFLVIDSDGLIEYMSGSQLSDSIGALTSLPANIVSSSTQISDLGFLTSLPSGTISSSAQISALGYLTSETDSQTLSIAGDQLTISNGNTITIPTGSDEATDISQLNVFSGSVQAEVDTLTQATASYVDNTDTVFVSQAQPTATAGGLYFDGDDFYLGV